MVLTKSIGIMTSHRSIPPTGRPPLPREPKVIQTTARTYMAMRPCGVAIRLTMVPAPVCGTATSSKASFQNIAQKSVM